jgi:hypothetical protein
MFYFVAAGDNTTSVTLNIDSLGAKAVTRDGSVALAAADIKSGEVIVVVYDGTRFQVVSQLNSAGNATFANVSITSALNVGGVVTLSGGTANGVLYLNGSKVATSGSALTFDGTDFATTGGVRLNNAQYYYGKNAAGTAVRLLGVNSGNVNYVGSIDSGPTEVNYGAASTITAQYWNISGSESMRLTSTGLGIGTASPSQKLHVVGSTLVPIANSYFTFDVRFGIGTPDSDGLQIFTGDYTRFGNRSAGGVFTEGMRLDSSGQLGIGTTTNALTNALTVYRSGSTQAAMAAGNSNTGLNGTLFGVDTAGNGIVNQTQVLPLIFSTSNTERARITSGGDLLVGDTSGTDARVKVDGTGNAANCAFWGKSSGGSAGPTSVIWNNATSGDNKFIDFYTEASATLRGSITYNRAGGLVAYNVTSDYRAKDILGPVQNSGATIDALKVYEGQMNGASQSRPMLVAHEAQEHAPYTVTGEKDAVNEDGTPKYQQMDVSALVPLLLAELQSLRKRVAELESK